MRLIDGWRKVVRQHSSAVQKQDGVQKHETKIRQETAREGLCPTAD